MVIIICNFRRLRELLHLILIIAKQELCENEIRLNFNLLPMLIYTYLVLLQSDLNCIIIHFPYLAYKAHITETLVLLNHINL